jgi:tRNA (guanine-N7-)-methyltransferase
MKTNRSFANRSRKLSPNQQLVFDDLWKIYGLDASLGQLDFATIFSNDLPVVLEIGFGDGDNLFNLAQSHPEFNYIGVEVYLPGVAKLITRLAEKELQNVRIFHGDVTQIFENNIPSASLAKILMFFPDPWPKRRHHKRRLLQIDFAKLMVGKLMKGGVIHLATDWENYAKQMLEVMESIQGCHNSAGKDNFSPRPEFRPLTKFEARGKRLGHSICDLAFTKL